MAKFYIATSLLRQEEHNLLRDCLVQEGHEISYDWTFHGSVKSVGKERLRQVACKEVQGVLDAEVVIVLLPGGEGTHVELGAALAAAKPVIIHSEQQARFELGEQTCAFYHHPNISQVVCSFADLQPLMDEIAARVHYVGAPI